MRAGTALGIGLSMVTLAGCAAAPLRRQTGATLEVFMKDRYSCIQQSQQNRSGANVFKDQDLPTARSS